MKILFEAISETDYNFEREKIFSLNYYEDKSKCLTKKTNNENI